MNTNEHDSDPRQRLSQLVVATLLGEANPEEAAEVERALAKDPELAAERARLAATIGLVRGLGEVGAQDALSPQAAADLKRAADHAQSSRLAPPAAPLHSSEGGARPWYRHTGLRLAAGAAAILGAGLLVRNAQRDPAGGEPTFAYKLFQGDGGAASGLGGEIVAKADASRPSTAPSLERQRPLPMAKTERAAGEVPATSAGSVDQGESAPAPATPGTAAFDARVADRFGVRDELNAVIKDSASYYLDAGEKSRIVSLENVQAGPAGAAAGPPTELLNELKKLGYMGGQVGATPSIPVPDATYHVGPVSESGSDSKVLVAAAREPAATSGPSSPGPQRGVRADEVASAESRSSSLGYASGAVPSDRNEEESADKAFFLGRFEEPRSEPVLDAPSSWRELAPQERDARIESLLASCRRRGGERPRDMFFRWWGDNPFEVARLDPLSTFSVDVDTASYTLARRYLAQRTLPEKAQIRTEEFVNYFKGDVPPPSEGTFAVVAELAPSLFHPAPERWTMRVALRGREVSKGERKPLALTFVVDVSGSMKEQNRLELVKHALRLLVSELDARDAVSLIAFSNEARLVLPMTSAKERGLIESAIHPLSPQGGTNVEAGLRMGYEAALAGLSSQATNRVVLLSDGVGNIGQTDAQRIGESVTHARQSGIYLNTVGVGMNNHNDAFLEQLADKGDGLCNYVDDEVEARRALVENFTGAFEPIARDVKIQVEFDPAQVSRYRLLGYENRAVADQDFRNDKVDAGEVGAGHQVVALYELERTGAGEPDGPLATVRVRWKEPLAAARDARARALEDGPATELAQPVYARQACGSFSAGSAGFRRSVLVAQLAEFLRRSVHAREASFETLLSESRKLAGELRDPEFDEFVHMVERTIELITPEWGRADDLARRLDALRRTNFLRAQVEELQGDLDRARLDVLDRQCRDLEDDIRRELRGEAPAFDAGRVRGLGYSGGK